MLKENLDKVFNEIKNGNNLGEPITLVGATKTISADVINQAVEYGLRVVAENKVQEFREKTDIIVGAKQHFIGHLQTNKVKYLVGKVELIHSVDSLHLAEEIDRVAKNRAVRQNVLVEINVGGELSKSGLTFLNAKEEVQKIIALCPNICVKGLMAMLPNTDDQDYLSSLCKKMRELFDDLKSINVDFTYLSMGMSNDYKLAINNGSNMIRLGRTLFGERNYGEKK